MAWSASIVQPATTARAGGSRREKVPLRQRCIRDTALATESVSTQQKPCAKGSFDATPGLSQCELYEPGTTSLAGSDSCTECGAGARTPQTLPRASAVPAPTP